MYKQVNFRNFVQFPFQHKNLQSIHAASIWLHKVSVVPQCTFGQSWNAGKRVEMEWLAGDSISKSRHPNSGSFFGTAFHLWPFWSICDVRPVWKLDLDARKAGCFLGHTVPRRSISDKILKAHPRKRKAGEPSWGDSFEVAGSACPIQCFFVFFLA